MSIKRVACLLCSVAIALPSALRAADAPPPCEEFSSDDFRDITAGGRMQVIDVGEMLVIAVGVILAAIRYLPAH